MGDGQVGAVEFELDDIAGHIGQLVGVLPVMVYRVTDGGPHWLTANAQQLTGFSQAELERSAGFWRARMHPDDIDAVQRELERAGSDRPYSLEYRWRHADGRYLCFLDQGRCERGVVERYGVILDITTQRSSEVQRRQLVDALITAQELERRRISRDLHDALGQTMTAISLRVAALRQRLGEEHDLAGPLTELADIADRGGAEVAALASSLRVPIVEELGLPAALHGLVTELASCHGLAVDVHVRGLDGDRRLPPAVESSLYRMVQESLNNVVKHAGAERASVIVDHGGPRLSLIVEDDGCGFDATDTRGGLGLSGMRERVSLLGGDMAIESRPGVGTTIRVLLPKT